MILQCQPWDEKSDIWSVACILIEMYSGSLFFATHDEVEHLAMIEKACGPVPLHMARDTQRSLIDNFEFMKYDEKQVAE